MGVLYTGYLDKRNPVSGTYKQRFVVLTLESLHWFKRSEGYDLFGEERGNLPLGSILTTRILDEDATTFEIQGTDTKKRFFRAPSNAVCEEWVSAVRSAIKLSQSANNKRGINRRTSLSGIKNFDIEDANSDENSDVTVLLMSLLSVEKHTETVIARKPDWNRIISVPNIAKGDQILLSTSNGGIIRLSYDTIVAKCEEGEEFETSIQNVKLASSLKITLTLESLNLGSMGAAAGGRVREKSVTTTDLLVDMAMTLSNDRPMAINLVLSMMVLVVAISSFRAIGVDTTLLFLFAALLSGFNCNTILRRVYAGETDSHKRIAVRMVLHGHAFTSPDAPIKAAEETIPQRFIDGYVFHEPKSFLIVIFLYINTYFILVHSCNGDVKEARRRWDITRHWREAEGVNHILEEPQPNFSLIKSMYPHFNCGVGKTGHHIFWERPGEFQPAQLAARGIRTEELVRHWLFCTEYQWEVMCEGDQNAKSIAVIDAKGVSMSDLAGSNMEYIKKTVGFANMHYPERSYVIFVVNAPFFASLAWKLVKPLVHENTQNKVKILSSHETLKGLLEHIDIDQIPEYYGGNMDFGGHDSCRFSCPDVVEMEEYVRKLNEGENGPPQSKIPFSDKANGDHNLPETPGKGDGSDSGAPPGIPGEDPMNGSNHGLSAHNLHDLHSDRGVHSLRRASSVNRPPSQYDFSSPASDGVSAMTSPTVTVGALSPRQGRHGSISSAHP